MLELTCVPLCRAEREPRRFWMERAAAPGGAEVLN